jgi:S1-C subfamily serine protease
VLLDSKGRVVGINAAILDPSGKGASSGVGFAIPIDTVKGLVEQILKLVAVRQGTAVLLLPVAGTPSLCTHRMHAHTRGGGAWQGAISGWLGPLTRACLTRRYGRVVRPALGVTLAPPQVLQRLGQPGVLVLEVCHDAAAGSVLRQSNQPRP